MTKTTETAPTLHIDAIDAQIEDHCAEIRKLELTKRKVITVFMRDLMSDKLIDLMSTTQLAQLMNKYLSRHGIEK